MRKLVSNLFITLDGVVESPETWSLTYWSDEIQDIVGAGMGAAGAMLLGRVSYEQFAAAWSGRTVADDPGADFMNGSRKYVASRTLESVGWTNCTLLEGDLARTVAALKEEDGGDLVTTGSPTLVRSLLSLGLVDELQLLVYPVVLGAGLRLFPEGGETVTLRLASATALSNGVGHLVYVPA